MYHGLWPLKSKRACIAEEATVVLKAHKWILWTRFTFNLHMYNLFDAFTMQQIIWICSNNYVSGSLRKIYCPEQYKIEVLLLLW